MRGGNENINIQKIKPETQLQTPKLELVKNKKTNNENYKNLYFKADPFVILGQTRELGMEKVPIVDDLGKYMFVSDYIRKYNVTDLKNLLENHKKIKKESEEREKAENNRIKQALNRYKKENAKQIQNQKNYNASKPYRLKGQSNNEALRSYLINTLKENTPIYNSKKYKKLKNKLTYNEIYRRHEATKKGLPEEIKKYISELKTLYKEEKLNPNILSKEFKDYLKEFELKIYNSNNSLNSKNLNIENENKITQVDETKYKKNDIEEIYHRLTKPKFYKKIATQVKANFFKDREDLNLINKLSLDELKELRDKYNEYKEDIKDGKDGNEFQLYKIQLVAKILNKK